MSYPEPPTDDREWLQWIRIILTPALLEVLFFEAERWKRVAINRELDRREALGTVLAIG